MILQMCISGRIYPRAFGSVGALLALGADQLLHVTVKSPRSLQSHTSTRAL